MSKERVEAFSDGVFAIILTLLVLELRVPEIANHSSFGQYAAAMLPLIPKFVSFVLSFVIISIHWVGHHYFFRHLRDAPLGLVWLNNLFLLWLCFMPFPTAMLGDHPTDQFPILLYGVNQLLAALTFFAFRSYAGNNKLFVDNESAKAMGPRHSIPAVTIFILSILLAFVNVYLSLICFLLVPLLYFVPNMIRSK
ncbi:MAG: TMEM175 family protein [Pyrinomonadaceae bacterium]